eukprot:6187634-Pleurochrysis_carterae.AAC.2
MVKRHRALLAARAQVQKQTAAKNPAFAIILRDSANLEADVMTADGKAIPEDGRFCYAEREVVLCTSADYERALLPLGERAQWRGRAAPWRAGARHREHHLLAFVPGHSKRAYNRFTSEERRAPIDAGNNISRLQASRTRGPRWLYGTYHCNPSLICEIKPKLLALPAKQIREEVHKAVFLNRPLSKQVSQVI